MFLKIVTLTEGVSARLFLGVVLDSCLLKDLMILLLYAVDYSFVMYIGRVHLSF